MKLRHAAALVPMGWYLMVPPTFQGQLTVNINAPRSEWRLFASYDSARACENERLALFKSGEAFSQAQRANPTTNEQSRAAQYIAAECIATDDPRVKGK